MSSRADRVRFARAELFSEEILPRLQEDHAQRLATRWTDLVSCCREGNKGTQCSFVDDADAERWLNGMLLGGAGAAPVSSSSSAGADGTSGGGPQLPAYGRKELLNGEIFFLYRKFARGLDEVKEKVLLNGAVRVLDDLVDSYPGWLFDAASLACCSSSAAASKAALAARVDLLAKAAEVTPPFARLVRERTDFEVSVSGGGSSSSSASSFSTSSGNMVSSAQAVSTATTNVLQFIAASAQYEKGFLTEAELRKQRRIRDFNAQTATAAPNEARAAGAAKFHSLDVVLLPSSAATRASAGGVADKINAGAPPPASSTTADVEVSGVYEVLPWNTWSDTQRPLYYCAGNGLFLFYSEITSPGGNVWRGWMVGSRPTPSRVPGSFQLHLRSGNLSNQAAAPSSVTAAKLKAAGAGALGAPNLVMPWEVTSWIPASGAAKAEFANDTVFIQEIYAFQWVLYPRREQEAASVAGSSTVADHETRTQAPAHELRVLRQLFQSVPNVVDVRSIGNVIGATTEAARINFSQLAQSLAAGGSDNSAAAAGKALLQQKPVRKTREVNEDAMKFNAHMNAESSSSSSLAGDPSPVESSAGGAGSRVGTRARAAANKGKAAAAGKGKGKAKAKARASPGTGGGTQQSEVRKRTAKR